ncbi:hypothetical protein M2152_001599 [Microbacteriaceae bacterium SG_E_30_P1]|uniref:Uncharacterized protein n=1 Tax=Antiquaquibacter oligotrophicus TaxID=2880260 RepID=A0ABT6KN30_9MICO|nr:hypothetical protein [Antiquaquibacter oligotrophicus]MDH6181417.1 hypothetical protein [Antiquaquibacter oligotrophicus]UDF12891.1 hypothetical protein LH407_12120 [Antiquaquibacter oligotrophicus]
MTWESFLGWVADWNQSQGFWTAVQAVGTVLAAAAALVAVIVARSQLAELTRSNGLLTNSNDSMTRSNIALTRPYVVIDFEFRPQVDRAGATRGTSIAVRVENAGKTPAKDLTLKVTPSFPLPDDPRNLNWRKAVGELNTIMNGETVIKSLTHVRPLSFYIDQAKDIMGDDVDAGGWQVDAIYYDAEGHKFVERTTLELSHWRRALVTVDPTYRIAKGVQAIAYEVKNQKVPSLDFTFESTPHRIGRPSMRGVSRSMRPHSR